MGDPVPTVWPAELMIRDTGLHDDMGGGGQRIYTTAGRGYEKRRYVLADDNRRTGQTGAGGERQSPKPREELEAQSEAEVKCLNRKRELCEHGHSLIMLAEGSAYCDKCSQSDRGAE